MSSGASTNHLANYCKLSAPNPIHNQPGKVYYQDCQVLDATFPDLLADYPFLQDLMQPGMEKVSDLNCACVSTSEARSTCTCDDPNPASEPNVDNMIKKFSGQINETQKMQVTFSDYETYRCPGELRIQFDDDNEEKYYCMNGKLDAIIRNSAPDFAHPYTIYSREVS